MWIAVFISPPEIRSRNKQPGGATAVNSPAFLFGFAKDRENIAKDPERKILSSLFAR